VRTETPEIEPVVYRLTALVAVQHIAPQDKMVRFSCCPPRLGGHFTSMHAQILSTSDRFQSDAWMDFGMSIHWAHVFIYV
jgi:hypothetical protein